MIIVMERGATEEQIQKVIDRLVNLDFSVHRSSGAVHTVLGGVGPNEEFDPEEFKVLPGVKECHRVIAPYRLASRSFRPEGTVVRFANGVEVGGRRVAVLAGPSCVESEEQIEAAAAAVRQAGAAFLRAGAFRPGRSPYQGPGIVESNLQLLRAAADRQGLLVASEVNDHTQIPMMLDYVDLLQVSSRNMQNYALLRELGAVKRPVLLKRGVSATIEELLLSAEYVLSGGNYDVILCERGIRTFETYAKYTMDLTAIPVVQKLSHLPMLADPSHGTGRRDKVTAMGRAAVAAGADGLMVEVHPDPESAQSDGAQSLFPEQFNELMEQCRMIAQAVGRSL
jgi:3-deoxy-7-phosphoheptulonate synthase